MKATNICKMFMNIDYISEDKDFKEVLFIILLSIRKSHLKFLYIYFQFVNLLKISCSFTYFTYFIYGQELIN